MAQRKADKRKTCKRKCIKFTPELKLLVDSLLQANYSPEQIKGQISLLKGVIVSSETIYKYIWQNKKQGGSLYTFLHHNGKKYRKRGATKDNRGILRNQVSIDKRPDIVDQKSRFGDLEIDTVIGENHKGALLTINDRKTGLVWITKLKDKEAEYLAVETVKTLLPFKDLIHTITVDNGKEFALHEMIARELNVDVYFAHPYHSWERGANENTNGLIRQFFPKGADFESLSVERIQIVEDNLNNRPRKRLGFNTPYEMFKQVTNQEIALVS